MKWRRIVLFMVYYVGINLILLVFAGATEANANNSYERGRFEYEIDNNRGALGFFKQAFATGPDRVPSRFWPRPGRAGAV